MKRNKPVNHGLADLLVAPIAAFCLLSMGTVNPAWAGKPVGGSTPPLDTGTIYYTAMGGTYGVWSMKPDGSAKTFLQTWPSPYATEPSQTRHNGYRWFLTLLDLSGTGTDYGIFAVNEDGSTIVQVTTLPDLVQPYIPNGWRDRAQLRWSARSDQAPGLIHDGRVSFLGLDGTTGELGVYAADIDPDALGSTGFEPVPSSRYGRTLTSSPRSAITRTSTGHPMETRSCSS